MRRILTREEVVSVEGLSSRAAARKLGVGKSSINDARKKFGVLSLDDDVVNSVRVLTIDIESKPITAWVWGLWDQNVSIQQIKENGGMMCFAAKWVGSDEVLFYSTFKDGYEGMLKAAWELLSEADIVITYNGVRYDNKRLNNEFLLAGMAPPKPYKNIDLIQTNKNRFDLPSRKLDYLVQQTGVGAKVSHTGFQLWIDCMNDDPEAWALMEEYNRGDVIVTEGAYFRILPWLTNSPHMGMFVSGGNVCPYCGSDKLTRDGETHTNVQTYPLYSCEKCKGWSRGTTKLADTTTTRAVR